MKTIGLWSEEEFEKFYDVTLVKTDDREYFDSFLNDVETQPEAVYELLPNGYANSNLFLYYIKYNYFNDDYCVKANSSKFFFVWEQFVNSMPSYNISALKSYLSIMNSYDFSLLRGKNKLTEVFEAFICKIIEPYVKGDIYINISTADLGIWWKMSNEIHREVALFINEYRSQDTIKVLLDPIIAAAERIQKNLNDIVVSQEVPLFKLSAYLFFLSKTSYIQGRFILSILLVHRALELYFQSLSIECDVTAFVGGTIRYSVDTSSVNVNLVTTETLLEKYGKISKDPGRTKFIKNLNDIRNKCLYAHGFLAFKKSTVETVLNKCERLITRLEGNSRWRSLSSSMGFDLNCEYKLLFDIEDNLGSYCNRIH